MCLNKFSLFRQCVSFVVVSCHLIDQVKHKIFVVYVFVISIVIATLVAVTNAFVAARAAVALVAVGRLGRAQVALAVASCRTRFHYVSLVVLFVWQ